MEELITPFNQIKKELQEIQNFLEITMSEDVNEAICRGNDLAVYMARAGKLLADAKYYRENKLKSEFIAQINEITSLAPSVAAKFVDSMVSDETLIMTWSERINRSCTHQLEWCRSVISKAKAEMQSFNYGNGNGNHSF